MLWDSNQDMFANKIGNYLGEHYPKQNCNDLLKPYISAKKPYNF